MMWGLVASSVEDMVPPRFIAWDAQTISSDAKLLAVYLADHADEFGEAIVDAEQAEYECGFMERDENGSTFNASLQELVDQGVLSFARLLGARLIAGFDVCEDWYLGDDTNPPADLWDSVGPCGEDYSSNDDEVCIDDPDPRRHRIFLKTNYRCFYCISAWAEHLDHMHPSSRGGGDEDANMIGACRACNIRKKDRTVEEFRAWLSHREKLPAGYVVRFYGEANA